MEITTDFAAADSGSRASMPVLAQVGPIGAGGMKYVANADHQSTTRPWAPHQPRARMRV